MPMPSRGTLLCSRGFAAISLCNSRTSEITELIFQAPRISICPSRTTGAITRNRKTLRWGIPAKPVNTSWANRPTTNRCRCHSTSAFLTGLPLLQRSPGARAWVTSQIPDQPAVPDDGGLLFWINPRRNYAPLDFDRTVNFAQTFTYQLPFGRGHSMFNSRLGDAVLGGWQLSGILQFVTGLPFTVQTNGANLNTPGTAQTGQLTGVYRVTHQIGGGNNHWFNPTAFSTPSGCSTSTPAN